MMYFRQSITALLCFSLLFLISTSLPAQQVSSLAVAAAAEEAGAQDSASTSTGNTNEVKSPPLWRKLQVHGTLSQGFVYGSGNNYLSMNTNDGSVRWSEAATNLNAAITDRLHAGVQLHSYILGELGRANVQVDWAYADYRHKDWMGFRGGKLKAPMGLFNEVEDTDTLYNWALLPQSLYEADWRSFNVPVEGGEVYGTLKVRRAGSFTYQLFGGRRSVASNDGIPLMAKQFRTAAAPTTSGFGGPPTGAPSGPPAAFPSNFRPDLTNSGYTYGADLKWHTPISGLTAGVSIDRSELTSPHIPLPTAFGPPQLVKLISGVAREIYSLQYQRGKFELDAEGKREAHRAILNGGDLGWSPKHAWYVMGMYHLNDKLTLGSYYSWAVGTNLVQTDRWHFYDSSKPEFYSKDTVVNARVDFNRYLYLKVEGHYIDGYLGAFFPGNNPNGFQKVTRLAITRLGFTF